MTEPLYDAVNRFGASFPAIRNSRLVYPAIVNSHWPINQRSVERSARWISRRLPSAAHCGVNVEWPACPASCQLALPRLNLDSYAMCVSAEIGCHAADNIVPDLCTHRVGNLITRLARGFLPAQLWMVVEPSAANDSSGAHQ